MLHFCLPLAYASYTTIMILKYQLLDLNMNLVTWSLYFANILVVYIIHKLGKVLDKCLEQFLRSRG